MPKQSVIHLFNANVDSITDDMLANIANYYTHIMISPIQFSTDNDNWWYRYQPLDYTIGGPIGSIDSIKTSYNEQRRRIYL